MKVSYYPGCSLEATAADYADSIRGVFGAFGVEPVEVPDWNCCGATAAHSIHHTASIELAGRNLRLAAETRLPEMVVPCPMCFNRLKAAVKAYEGENRTHYAVQPGAFIPRIHDLANFFAAPEMLEKVREKVVRPLTGLKVVSYYGCMASRPPEVTEARDAENPQSIDTIMTALGAEVIDWPYKTDCCGASQQLSRPDMMAQLVGKLFDMARKLGAGAVVVSCQMCHANLDMRQERVNTHWGRELGLPVLYFTEMIGLAAGLPDTASWLSRHITDPRPLLSGLGLL